MKQGEGMKYDAGKPRTGVMMIDFANALKEVAKVSTYGCEKYKAHSWRNVPDGHERYFDAFCRHFLDYCAGEVADPESNLTHISHMIWNLLAVSELSVCTAKPKSQEVLADEEESKLAQKKWAYKIPYEAEVDLELRRRPYNLNKLPGLHLIRYGAKYEDLMIIQSMNINYENASVILKGPGLATDNQGNSEIVITKKVEDLYLPNIEDRFIWNVHRPDLALPEIW